MMGQSMEALAKSLEERHALEGELNQIRNIAQVVVFEVFGSASSTSMPAVQLVEVPSKVQALNSDGMSGVLTSVATHHPDLDFVAICKIVRRRLEPGRHPCAWGKLAATRIVGGRASLRAVGDGGSPFERG